MWKQKNKILILKMWSAEYNKCTVNLEGLVFEKLIGKVRNVRESLIAKVKLTNNNSTI